MKRYSMLTLIVLVSLLISVGLEVAESCTIAVVSGSATTDGRPLLWKNRDTDYLDQEVRYFSDGFHGGYITIVSTGVDETTTSYVGVNDDGFAIMNANAPDLTTGSPTSHGILMKKALRECGSVEDFETLLIETSGNREYIWANFGVIDRFGGAAIFEANDWDYVRYDADAEGGFVVRANFSIWGGGDPGSRYERAYHLVSSAVDSGELNHEYLIQTISKDIGGPPFLPCGEWLTTDPAISRHRTQSAAVVHGVLPSEDPRLSTFWCVLGEPSLGVTVPLWSYAGNPPPEIFAPGQQAPMCAEIHEKELYCYSNLTGDTTIDTNALVGDDGLGGIQGYSLPIEVEAFADADAKLTDWRVVFPTASEIAQFQAERTSRTYFYYDGEIAPGDEGPIAAFSGLPTSGEIPLAVIFTDESINAESWQWTFGDGGTSTVQNPSHTYTVAGVYTVSLTVTNDFGSDTDTKVEYIAVTEPESGSEAFAQGETTIYGTISGSYLNTQARDGSYEILTEELFIRNSRKRYSHLEHSWNFNVASGSAVTFKIEAYRPSNGDGDDFLFEYSTDGVNFAGLLTVASATEQLYTVSLPSNTSGAVTVRVSDTNRVYGAESLDALYVDYMVIETAGTQPLPPVASFSGSPTSGIVPLTVNFTDESGNAPTSWIWEFGDGEGSTSQNPVHIYVAAGVYSVTLTASNSYGEDTHTEINFISVIDPAGNTMHVYDIVVTRKIAGPNHSGVADITIHDESEIPVANATVFAIATGPVSGSFYGLTGVGGTVHFETGKTKNASEEWCFEVTDVTHSSQVYDFGANVVTSACESGDVYKVIEDSSQITSIGLEQNYPDPFNPETEIIFNLREITPVQLTVFNVQGQRIATLVDDVLTAGRHRVRWDAGEFSSGVYFYHLEANGFRETRKMILLK
jgi:PKD repeat protein